MDLARNWFAHRRKQRNEAASFEHSNNGIASLFAYELKLLGLGRADGNDHAAAFNQLIE
jgi:hypothetical protein